MWASGICKKFDKEAKIFQKMYANINKAIVLKRFFSLEFKILFLTMENLKLAIRDTVIMHLFVMWVPSYHEKIIF